VPRDATDDHPRTGAARPGAVVTRRLRRLLHVVLALFAALVANSAFLATVSWGGGAVRGPLEGPAYLWMFLAHLVLGLLLVLPFVAFAAGHLRRAWGHTNRRAVAMGFVALAAALAILVTGLALLRPGEAAALPQARVPEPRGWVYALHVAAPMVVVWAFLLHRLAGRAIRWRAGAAFAGATAAMAAALLAWHQADVARLDERAAHLPTLAELAEPPAPDPRFAPALLRTASGQPLPERALRMDDYCVSCHADAGARHAQSVHAASSFNNPLYAFSVRETRRRARDHDGSVADARFCAGCHDPVPLLTGQFDDARFDDPALDLAANPIASASITCTTCHGVVAIGSTRGNADLVVEESPQYPFAASESAFLRWVNRQLILAKPSFHARTFLKPEVHRSAEFCGACHKVFIPQEVNDYRWLPGQNHYDSWRLSNRSGHGVQGWYWPKHAETDCAGCHMPAQASSDPGAKVRRIAEGPVPTVTPSAAPGGEALSLRDHAFRSANTATPALAGLPHADAAVAECQAFNRRSLRLDLFALRADGQADGAETAPLGEFGPALRAGGTYLVEAVVRALAAMGHEFTQGTADSNEVWLDVTVRTGDRVIGRMGAMDAKGGVDPWSKFLNVYMLDRDGNRIDRRNPQDIFVPLYNHQVPPGAADLTRLAFTVPADARGPVVIDAAVRYRKFDATYMRHAYGSGRVNDLPILTLATDRVTFSVEGGVRAADDAHGPPGVSVGGAADVPEWERWYDAAIARFRVADRAPGKGQWALADEAFARVAAAGRVEGWIGRARVALRDGRLDEAADFLRTAAAKHPGELPWAVTYWSAVIDLQQGAFERAIEGFRTVAASQQGDAAARGFDFSRDDRMLVEWATACLEQARALRSPDEGPRRAALLAEAAERCERALREDSQRFQAWYVRAQVAAAQGAADDERTARAAYERYRPDDNARDRAERAARARDPAADHAVEPAAIYDLGRGVTAPAATAAAAPAAGSAP
jgi:tetratricopeptide (TPR) repeat protein